MIERLLTATEAGAPPAAGPLPAEAGVSAPGPALDGTGVQPPAAAAPAARLDLQNGGRWIV